MEMDTIVKVMLLFVAVAVALGCSVQDGGDDPYLVARQRMVKEDIAGRGIDDARLLEAMLKVERHLFVPEHYRHLAYADRPLPIGEGQTISQPYIVALMTYHLRLRPEDRVLEIGTGSGYQAAVLAELAKEVYSIEIIEPLAKQAAERLLALGYQNVTVRCGDGFFGWPEHAPFDAIIVTCAPPSIPERLVEQLKDGGRMILPLGRDRFHQVLTLVTKEDGKVTSRAITDVVFVPMTGEIEK